MKNFANFIGKHMQGSPVLRKAAGMGLQLYKKPYKNTTCILRWKDVEKTVSTSFQRGIHVECL